MSCLAFRAHRNVRCHPLARLIPIVLALAVAAPPAHATALPPFAPSSAWNQALTHDAPLAPDSAALALDLKRQVNTYGAWINTTSYSTPVYTVPADQPLVKVKLDTTYPALQRDFDAVPLPSTAKPANGTDKHLTVYQPSTDTLWEFWLMTAQSDGWHARWGGKMTNVSANAGAFPNPLGATGTGLPLLGGLMRIDELSSRRIDHALALAVPQVRKSVFSLPATRTDGSVAGLASIPAGTRFRLPADLDVSALQMPSAVRAMARAVQRHGMVVRDGAGAVVFYAEDPARTGSNPYPAIFGTGYMDVALRNFPWSRLEVVAAPAGG
jgi:hypothetical protein